jgi:hypothetical protein
VQLLIRDAFTHPFSRLYRVDHPKTKWLIVKIPLPREAVLKVGGYGGVG